MFDAVGGGAVAARTVARWSGRALDPEITAVFADAPGELLAVASPDDLWAAVVDAEPGPRRTFRDEVAFDEALAGFGDAADLKSPWFTGHSRGVAALARVAAELASPAEAIAAYRARIRPVWYGCSRTCSHSSARSGPGRSQTPVGTATRPRSCSSPAR